MNYLYYCDLLGDMYPSSALSYKLNNEVNLRILKLTTEKIKKPRVIIYILKLFYLNRKISKKVYFAKEHIQANMHKTNRSGPLKKFILMISSFYVEYVFMPIEAARLSG